MKSFEKSTALTSIDTLDLSDTVFAECSEQVSGSDEPELSLQILEESPHAKELRTAFKAYRSKPRSTVHHVTQTHTARSHYCSSGSSSGGDSSSLCLHDLSLMNSMLWFGDARRGIRMRRAMCLATSGIVLSRNSRKTTVKDEHGTLSIHTLPFPTLWLS